MEMTGVILSWYTAPMDGIELLRSALLLNFLLIPTTALSMDSRFVEFWATFIIVFSPYSFMELF